MAINVSGWMDKIKGILTPKILMDAVKEPDGKRVSSARIWGGIIITVLLACNVALVGTMSYGIWKCMYYEPHDILALKTIVDGIKDMAYLYFIMAATALALYGINVFKYISEIKNGVANTIDQAVASAVGEESTENKDTNNTQKPAAINNPQDDK